MHGKVSPFVRKVMICAIEKGLDHEIEVVPTAVGQGKTNPDLMAINPIGKIPTLVTDSGEAIFDSLVICDYLDGLVTEPRMFPLEPSDRTAALTVNAVGDGLIGAGVLAKLERSKPPERVWTEFANAQFAKVDGCVAALDTWRMKRGDRFDIGTIGAACALGWLDARAPEIPWRARFPDLAAWADRIGERESFVRTQPPKA